jgi:hypothetical protein
MVQGQVILEDGIRWPVSRCGRSTKTSAMKRRWARPSPIKRESIGSPTPQSYIVYGQTLPFITTKVPPPLDPLIIITPNDSSDDITADELAANPENTNAKAYETLKGAVHPLTLPYNQPMEVARVYLDHLGSSRYEVMRTFQKVGIPADLDIACEYLGISPELRDILTGVAMKVPPDNLRDYNLRDFYGYGQTEHTPSAQPTLQPGPDVIALQHLLNSASPKTLLTVDGVFDKNTKDAVTGFQQSHGLPQTGNVDAATWAALNTVEEIWLAYLAQIPEFLNRTGTSYLEVVDLFKTRFINPDLQTLNYFESLKIKYQDLADWLANGYMIQARRCRMP